MPVMSLVYPLKTHGNKSFVFFGFSFRLNRISSVIPDEPDFLRHVTQLDVRDNHLSELDASLFPRLEVLHCQRNRITRLRLRGSTLKALYASSNGKHVQTVHPKITRVTPAPNTHVLNTELWFSKQKFGIWKRVRSHLISPTWTFPGKQHFVYCLYVCVYGYIWFLFYIPLIFNKNYNTLQYSCKQRSSGSKHFQIED